MPSAGERPRTQVRRRHAWTIVFRADVSEEIAEQSLTSRSISLGKDWLDEIEIIGPLCRHCEQEYEAAAWSCPGEAIE